MSLLFVLKFFRGNKIDGNTAYSYSTAINQMVYFYDCFYPLASSQLDTVYFYFVENAVIVYTPSCHFKQIWLAYIQRNTKGDILLNFFFVPQNSKNIEWHEVNSWWQGFIFGWTICVSGLSTNEFSSNHLVLYWMCVSIQCLKKMTMWKPFFFSFFFSAVSPNHDIVTFLHYQKKKKKKKKIDTN